MRRFLAIIVGSAVIFGIAAPKLQAQEDRAERIGEQIDRGLEQLGERLRKTWADIRRSVDELGVRGRVYGRLRWDKALAQQTIDIQVQERDVVVLKGTVPNQATREKAVQLAQDTVGVRDVIDELRVETQQDPPTE